MCVLTGQVLIGVARIWVSLHASTCKCLACKIRVKNGKFAYMMVGHVQWKLHCTCTCMYMSTVVMLGTGPGGCCRKAASFYSGSPHSRCILKIFLHFHRLSVHVYKRRVGGPENGVCGSSEKKQ